MNLSVLIPARNERFLDRTIQDVLDHAERQTEVVAVLDGYWPDPPIRDRPGLVVVHYPESIGQRAATNAAARLARGTFVMKLDAHCAVAQGFDRVLLEPYESGELTPDTTTIPRMYNLHVFDWLCEGCGARYYQADPVAACACGGTAFTIAEVWQPRTHKLTDFARFDATMHFQYWRKYRRRPEAQGEIADVLSSVGACFLMRRDRFDALGGLDEAHGGWGQFGTEIACKSWLSGGRQVVNKRTWFAHFFRVGKLTFPYPLSWEAQERARIYSRDLWLQDKWPGAVRPLSWLVEKFAPVPGWHEAEPAEAARDAA
jgi:glycosyltransferase involved in cell wall biosynthesis